MQFVIKLGVSIAVIIVCTQIGRTFPVLGGLIATMPLTGAIVLAWLYTDNPGNVPLMKGYTKGAVWGIIPSMLFFICAYICFHKHLPLSLTLLLSLSAWLVGACIHNLLLH